MVTTQAPARLMVVLPPLLGLDPLLDGLLLVQKCGTRVLK